MIIKIATQEFGNQNIKDISYTHMITQLKDNQQFFCSCFLSFFLFLLMGMGLGQSKILIKYLALTLSVPNFRWHLSFAFLFTKKLSAGNKYICKVEWLHVKQRISWWDGSLWAVWSGSTLFAKAYYHHLW